MGKRGASITVNTGPWKFGDHVDRDVLITTWDPGKGKAADGYWARIDASQLLDGQAYVVYSEYQSLSSETQAAGFTFGPTPSWSGGSASAHVALLGITNGVFSALAESADFIIEG